MTPRHQEKLQVTVYYTLVSLSQMLNFKCGRVLKCASFGV